MHTFKRCCLLVLLCLMLLPAAGQTSNKRAFRGTWIHTVGQDKYASMNEASMKRYFITLLDGLHNAGINTLLFQVRPEADAWYASSIEPWSRYITGVQGKNPGWDPLAFMVEEGHKRAMEVHAWINPYRVRTSPTKTLTPDHLFNKNRTMFVEYGDYIWFDPGLPASRQHVLNVIKDLVSRYDIDAIHMDDYFYPYPIEGKTFNDSESFKKYGLPKGFTQATKADWRRDNINTLIKEIHELIHKTKPWVQFGVSPFGIYRNSANGVNGSKTKGFTNYDGLYADIMLWVQKGWVDYLVPQLYWEIGHRSADYQTLLTWWSANHGQVPLYIGQDVVRTIRPDSSKRGQLWKKMQLANQESAVTGHCFWPAYELESNTGGIVDSLKRVYYRYPALHPADNAYDQTPPQPIRNLTLKRVGSNVMLSWEAPEGTTVDDKAAYYVVYRFKKTDKQNLEQASNILTITTDKIWAVNAPASTDVFVITAVDRCHNESTGVSAILP